MKKILILLFFLFVVLYFESSTVYAQTFSTCQKEGNICKTLKACPSNMTAQPDICESFTIDQCPFSLACMDSSTSNNSTSLISVPQTGNNGETLTVTTHISIRDYQARDPELRLFNSLTNQELTCQVVSVGSKSYTFDLPLESNEVSVQLVEGGHNNNGLKGNCNHPSNVNIIEEHKVQLQNPVSGTSNCNVSKTKDSKNQEFLVVKINKIDCNRNLNIQYFSPTLGLDSHRDLLGERSLLTCSNSIGTVTFNFIDVVAPTSNDKYFVVVKGDYTFKVIDKSDNELVTECKYFRTDGPEYVGEFGEPIPILSACNNISKTDKAYENCVKCTGGIYDVNNSGSINDDEIFEQKGAYTAFGCIPTDLSAFFKDYFFVTGLGFAGGIAFLLMLWGGFTIVISQGDPQKIQQGREIIVSAGVGLLFIIFSIVILKFIGADILKIPGFS